MIPSLSVFLLIWLLLFLDRRRFRMRFILESCIGTFYFVFVLLFCLIIYMLIASFIKMRSLKKSTGAIENSRFDTEQERFWLYVCLFVFTYLIWFVEYYTLSLYSYEAEYVGDVIKILSATLISCKLLFKPKVKFFLKEKYSFFRNDSVISQDI